MNFVQNSPRRKLNKSSKSLLWQEEDRWLVRGLETKEIHGRFRVKHSALEAKSRIEKVYLEQCEIVFEEKEVENE